MEKLLTDLEEFVRGGRKLNAAGILRKKECARIACIIKQTSCTRDQLSRLENLLKQLHGATKNNLPLYKGNCEKIVEALENGKKNRRELLQSKLWTSDDEEKFKREFEILKKTYAKWREGYKHNFINDKYLSRLRQMAKKSLAEFEVETTQEFVGGVTVEENRRQVYANMIQKEWDDRKALMVTLQNKIKITKLKF